MIDSLANRNVDFKIRGTIADAALTYANALIQYQAAKLAGQNPNNNCAILTDLIETRDALNAVINASAGLFVTR